MNPCHVFVFVATLTAARLASAAGGSVSITLPAADAVLDPPMALVDGALHQAERSDLPGGGSATFTFSVAEAGDYEVSAEVNAPGGGSNSYYVAIDGRPDGPAMIWDIDPTDGYAERIVSWRGSGTLDEPEFQTKVFTLQAGEHTLVLVGREPARLRSLSIRRHVPVQEGSLRYLKSRYDAAERAFRRKVEALEETPENETVAEGLWRELGDQQAALFMQAVKLAEANPASPEGWEALEWVLLIPRSHYLPAGPAALAVMREHFAADPRIGRVVALLVFYLPDRSEPHFQVTVDLFRAVLAQNQEPTARGQAALGMAFLDKAAYQQAEAGGDAAQVAVARSVVEAAFEGIVRDYDDCADLRYFPRRPDQTLGARARRELHEIRDLSIGRLAPEIDAADIEGQPMKLSDHRGKVVLLVFWASWCGPCMAAVPHEKELVEHFKGRPFVLIGVNGDETREAAVRAVARHQIPWRSFWNDEVKGPNIARAWNIRGWPTLYLIDHRGVIRDKYAYGKELDARLEELVAGAELDP